MVNGNGHLNPAGNLFFAYAIKNKVTELLDAKPLTYQKRGVGKLDKDYFINARLASSEK